MENQSNSAREMTDIKLTYEWSELDKVDCFGLTSNTEDVHYRWVWFYLGQKLKGISSKKYRLYPFNLQSGTVLYTYKYRPADQIAESILKQMMKRIK